MNSTELAKEYMKYCKRNVFRISIDLSIYFKPIVDIIKNNNGITNFFRYCLEDFKTERKLLSNEDRYEHDFWYERRQKIKPFYTMYLPSEKFRVSMDLNKKDYKEIIDIIKWKFGIKDFFVLALTDYLSIHYKEALC